VVSHQPGKSVHHSASRIRGLALRTCGAQPWQDLCTVPTAWSRWHGHCTGPNHMPAQRPIHPGRLPGDGFLLGHDVIEAILGTGHRVQRRSASTGFDAGHPMMLLQCVTHKPCYIFIPTRSPASNLRVIVREEHGGGGPRCSTRHSRSSAAVQSELRVERLCRCRLPSGLAPRRVRHLRAVRDLSVVDGRHAARHHYDDRVEVLGSVAVSADTSYSYVAPAETAWRMAPPFTQWWAEHPRPHRDDGTA
jgi:hypothetical protein